MTEQERNGCGGCTMCCKLLGIAELKKPSGKWCPHCKPGVGCKIYETKPNSCTVYECLWLTSQDRPKDEVMVPALRPDRCKVVISPSTNPRVISVHVDPGFPTAWKDPPVKGALIGMAAAGFKVVIGWGNTTRKVALELTSTGIVGAKTIHMTEPDKDGMQWSIPEGGTFLHRD